MMLMIEWKRTGREAGENGESKTFYESTDGRWLIESRKRAIPHANRVGYWLHTTYWLINADNLCEQKEYYSLKDAKEAAEHK